MVWYLWLALAAFAFCVVAFLCSFLHLIRLGSPKDRSQPVGKVSAGVVYSCTTAMLPQNKESAYLHLPTYTAGIIYHIGNFLALATFVWLFIASLIDFWPPLQICGTVEVIHQIISVILLISAACGICLLIKRCIKKELKAISSFDDYFSNIVCTLVQIFTIIYCLSPSFSAPYFVMVAVLMIWMPIGKIKHLLFFFMARYHLGFFYGRRGVWPPHKNE